MAKRRGMGMGMLVGGMPPAMAEALGIQQGGGGEPEREMTLMEKLEASIDGHVKCQAHHAEQLERLHKMVEMMKNDGNLEEFHTVYQAMLKADESDGE